MIMFQKKLKKMAVKVLVRVFFHVGLASKTLNL